MLAQRLKELRLENKLTQKGIAEKLDISYQAYQSWENGKKKPTADKLPDIAKLLHTSTDYLLGKTYIKNSSELTETDIAKILDNDTASFDGKPLNEHDRQILTQVIKDYFDGTLKEYD